MIHDVDENHNCPLYSGSRAFRLEVLSSTKSCHEKRKCNLRQRLVAHLLSRCSNWLCVVFVFDLNCIKTIVLGLKPLRTFFSPVSLFRFTLTYWTVLSTIPFQSLSVSSLGSALSALVKVHNPSVILSLWFYVKSLTSFRLCVRFLFFLFCERCFEIFYYMLFYSKKKVKTMKSLTLRSYSPMKSLPILYRCSYCHVGTLVK